jgi:hypothetical protein
MSRMDAPPYASARIFISYRREETAYAAGWLFDRLTDRFGRNQVFKDVDCIEPGQDFVDEIDRAVGSCEVLLALIGTRWLSGHDDRDRPRLEAADDYVRLEIEAALHREVRVIPVLVDGAPMPRAADLPPSLVHLVRRQAFELSPGRFNSDAANLFGVLERILPEDPVQPSGSRGVGRGSSPGPRRHRRRRGVVLVGAALAVAIIISAVFLWPSGNQPQGNQTDKQQLDTSKVLPEDVLVVSVDEGLERHVYAVSANDGKRYRLIERDRAHGPVISPNRDEVIYLIGSVLGTPHMVAADGRGDRPILTKRPKACKDVGRVAWSEAEPIMALVCLQADGSSKIALVEFPDGEFVRWLPTGAYTKADDPAFSTDSTRIAYWASKESDSTSGQLFICSTHSGATPHPLMLGQSDADPVWSPDDNTIAFSRDTTQLGTATSRAIFLVGSDPGEEPTPTPLRAKQPGVNDRPVWSPDGTQVAFVHTSQTASTQDLWIVNVQDRKRRRLNINADKLGTPNWR